ncbi:MAG TPA: alkaline phosphatase family protein [Thermoanaerobaculia bacterium]
MSEREPLESVRAELRRLGYLSHRFERYLLQDALAPRGGWQGLLRLAARGGLLVAVLLATAASLALAAANRLLGAPAELALLFVHVGVPTLAASTLGLLALLVAYRAVLAVARRRGQGVWRLALAGAGALGVTGVGLALGWQFLLELPRGGRVAVAVAVPLVAVAIAKLIADALLALGIRLTRQVPPERMIRRRWIAASAVVSALVTGGAALLLSPPRPRPEPVALPVAPGERVALVGVDGVLADEVDYRLASGALPRLAELLHAGGVVARLERPAPSTPAETWTTIATGRSPADHGVRALDGFRLLGMRTVLARPGPWRLLWSHAGAALGVAEQRPLLSGVRRAPAVWELVARGGRPVVVVNWWGTYPAEPTPGLLLAHGGWEQLAAGDRAAVAPAAAFDELAALAREVAAAGAAAPADLPLAADAFHRRVATGAAAAAARAVAVYLPALDLIAASGVTPRAAFAALVDHELAAADALAGELAKRATTVVVVFDPGRRGGSEGRVIVARAGCAAGERPSLDARGVAPLVARAAGLPQSAELPEPPDFCAWPEPPARLATYGERRPTAATATAEREYLETLRSLGYL